MLSTQAQNIGSVLETERTCKKKLLLNVNES